MEEIVNKKLDILSEKIIKEASVKSPSFNFTDTVMSQIETLSSQSIAIQYEPLISKKSWVIVIGMFMVLFFLAVYGVKVNSTSWMNNIDLSLFLDNRFIKSLSGLSMSKHLSYSILFLCLFVCIQIPFLKNYFDKRLE